MTGLHSFPAGPAHGVARRTLPTSPSVLPMPAPAVFDCIVGVARLMFDVPAAILRVREKAGWITAMAGIAADELPACLAACARMAALDAPTVSADGPAEMQFCAGIPLAASEAPRGAAPRGALCLFGPLPFAPEAAVHRRLLALADLAVQTLATQRRLGRAVQQANEAVLMARQSDYRLRGSLDLVSEALLARAGRSRDAGERRALFEAAGRLGCVETVHDQLCHGHEAFQTDARDYLLALISNLQGAAADDDAGRTIALLIPEQLDVPSDCLGRLGMVVTALVAGAWQHGSLIVEVGRRDATSLSVSVREEGAGTWLGGAVQRGVLDHLATLAMPGGVAVDPMAPRRISVHLAA